MITVSFRKKIKKLYCERRRNVGNGITSYSIFFLKLELFNHSVLYLSLFVFFFLLILIILYFSKGTIFHVYQAPVVVTLLVGMNANLGAVRSTAIPLLKEVLEPLCATLLNSLAPAQVDQQGYYQ